MENITSLDSPEIKELIAKYSPFFKEVKKRIIITVIIFVLASLVGFLFYEKIIIFLIGALSMEGVNVVFTSPFQFINLSITCGLAVGLIIVFPLIVFQFFSFIRPALSKREYKTVVGFLPLSLILFVVGFIFGTVIMKWQIQIFLERSVSLGIGNVLDISGLLSVVLLTSVLMGIGFQFPIILAVFLRLGIIKHEQLASKRLYIYAGSIIFALLLPPDSILADVFLSLPLIILFELTLLLNRFRRK